jgi:hypothetical protein
MVHGLGVRSIHSDSHTNIIVTNAKLQARTRTGKACTTVILMPEWGRSAHAYAATKLTSAADGSDLGRSSTAATNVTYAVVFATSTWSSTRGKCGPRSHTASLSNPDELQHQQLLSAAKQHDPCHRERLLSRTSPEPILCQHGVVGFSQALRDIL